MRLAVLAVFTVILASGCASRLSTGDGSDTVRTRAPVNYENTITNYFDFNVADDPRLRKLVFSPPEASKCALFGGSGGATQGFVVPVIYDTSPRPQAQAQGNRAGAVAPAAVAAAPAEAAKPTGKNAKNQKGKKPVPPPLAAVSTSGTLSATPGPAIEPQAVPTTQPLTFKEIQITGNRYFFWFNNETISAVTRRMDLCP